MHSMYCQDVSYEFYNVASPLSVPFEVHAVLEEERANSRGLPVLLGSHGTVELPSALRAPGAECPDPRALSHKRSGRARAARARA